MEHIKLYRLKYFQHTAVCVSVRIQQQLLLDKLANVFLSLEGALFSCMGVLYSLNPAFFAEAKLPVKNSINVTVESTECKIEKLLTRAAHLRKEIEHVVL